jgi:hypothetical protein
MNAAGNGFSRSCLTNLLIRQTREEHGFLKVSKSGIEWTRMDLIFVKFA